MKTLANNPNRSVQTNHIEESPAAPARTTAPGRLGRILRGVAVTAGIAAACGTANAQTMSVGPFGNAVGIGGGGGGGGESWLTTVNGYQWFSDPDRPFFRQAWTPDPVPPQDGDVWGWRSTGLREERVVNDFHTLAAPFNAPAGTTPWGNVHMTFDLSVPSADAMVSIFTFMGRKNGDYAADLGPMTGFDPSNIPAFTGHTMTGNSGTPFISDTLGVFDASLLPGLFPQFNMVNWIGGSGPVTVLSTTMPVAELGIPIPTPGAAALLGLGALMATRRRRS